MPPCELGHLPPYIGGPSTLKVLDQKNVSDAQKLDKLHNCARSPHVSCLAFFGFPQLYLGWFISDPFQFESSTVWKKSGN